VLFCDISSFYAPTAGGIRTYHDAKIDWFASQDRHRYLLVHPGPRATVMHPAPTVTCASVYGVRARGGYRLPVDFRGLHTIVRDARPDVLETGDPWFSGPLGLLFKRWRHTALVSSFFHGDPMHTYVEPWVARSGVFVRLKRGLGTRADRYFYRVQRMYDVTVTSSAWVESMLRARGVERILRMPFGVDPLFLAIGRRRRPRLRRSRLLYAGRLQGDKGIDVLLAAVPELLRLPDTTLTIAGTGPLADAMARIASSRVCVVGFVSSREELARLYADHDVLLAPGPYETFGLAALEGLAAGLSVVGPAAGGTQALLRDLERPHLFAKGDVRDFLRAVAEAIEADGAVEARAGIAIAERYGNWRHAIGVQVDTYCSYWSRSTT
jgi:alpha-1,6-mannosyltransferase